jgi:hypothetical protein
VPAGSLTLHDELVVCTPEGTRHSVPYWVAGDRVHAADPVRAFIWLPVDADPG